MKQIENIPLHEIGDNNLLPSQTINSNQNEEALTDAVITMNLTS